MWHNYLKSSGMKQLQRHEGHKSYWIDEGQLYETYEVFPNTYSRHIMEVKGMADCERCTKEMVKKIKEEYLKQ